MENIGEQLRQLKHNHQLTPDASWVLENKQRMMKRIVNAKDVDVKAPFFLRLQEGLQIFVSRRVFGVMRPAVSFALVVFLIVGSWGVSVASAGSVPGQTLYPAKKFTEKVRVFTAKAVSDSAKVQEVRWDIIARRVEEKKIVAKNIANKATNVEVHDTNTKELAALAQLDKDIQEQLTLVTQDLDQTLTENVSAKEKVEEVSEFKKKVSNLNEDLDVVKEGLEEVVENDDALLEQDKSALKEVTEGHLLLEVVVEEVELDVLDKAVAVVGESTEEEKSDVVKEVVELVSEKATDIAEDAGILVEDASAVKEQQDLSDLFVGETNTLSSSSTLVDTTASSTGSGLDITLNSVLEKATETKEKVDIIVQDISEETLGSVLEQVKVLQTETKETKLQVDMVKEEIEKTVEKSVQDGDIGDAATSLDDTTQE